MNTASWKRLLPHFSAFISGHQEEYPRTTFCDQALGSVTQASPQSMRGVSHCQNAAIPVHHRVAMNMSLKPSQLKVVCTPASTWRQAVPRNPSWVQIVACTLRQQQATNSRQCTLCLPPLGLGTHHATRREGNVCRYPAHPFHAALAAPGGLGVHTSLCRCPSPGGWIQMAAG